ncbi:MAG: pitrilysin family protein [Bacteroides sp.]|nr:insulinase family protein [Bacteroides sp.]MDD2644620.1 pitrilysin family protein [Bacteroides sp.]MDD4054567.1 pitrilysin family protein [Bacteroides sp.]MDD4719341.1 pitrilysin family protein [Bacteroides sp.]
MRKLNRTETPEVKAINNIEFFQPAKIKMPNGIPLEIIDVGVQDVVRIDILFEGGRWQQDHKLQSLFTNRMLREGTNRYTSSEISEKLDFYGSWMQFSNYPKHTCVTLYSLSKYFKEALDILYSIIIEPLFPEKELSRLRDRSKQQFLVHSSRVSFIANRLLFHSLYGSEHPIGNTSVPEDFLKISSSDLRTFHEKYYNSEGCSIYLSGKISTAVLQDVETVFGEQSFGNKADWKATLYPIKTSQDKRITFKKEGALQNAVRMGSLTINKGHADYLKFRVLVTLFGGYFGSRLMSNIREDKGYTYGISSSLIPYPDSSVLLIASDTDPKYVESLIEEVYKEMRRLKSEKVSANELSKVKNYMIGDLCRNYETAFSIADAWLAVKTSDLNQDYFAKMLSAIEDVSVDDIYVLANRYFNEEIMREVIVGQ